MGFFNKLAKGIAMLTAVFAVVVPLLSSHLVGGWTREYIGNPAGFTPASIADMSGKNVIVTGANTGIGRETVLELARKGATVFAACRSPAKCDAAVSRVKAAIGGPASVTAMVLDLGSFASIESFAAEFNGLGVPLHVLVNNAGVMKSPGAEIMGQAFTFGWDTTEEGFEYHIGVNHIGHFKLTALLMPALEKAGSARVIAVSSAAEAGGFPEGMRYEMWSEKGDDYEDGRAYSQSKLANLLFARELAHRTKGTGITAYSLHPGVIKTQLMRYLSEVMTAEATAKGKLAVLGQALFTGFFNLVQFDAPGGALTQLHLATAEVGSLVNGGYYVPVGQHVAPNHPMGLDEALQKELWTKTEEAIAAHSQE